MRIINKLLEDKFPWYAKIIGIIIILGFLIGMFFLLGWVLMSTWNKVMPEIFSLSMLNLKQACNLLLIPWVLVSFPIMELKDYL